MNKEGEADENRRRRSAAENRQLFYCNVSLSSRQPRQWHHLDAFFHQGHGLVSGRLPANAALLDITVVHGTCLIGKPLTHILGFRHHLADHVQ